MNIKTSVDARKERYDDEAAFDRLKSARRIRVAKGKKVLEFAGGAKIDREALLKAAMGPSGNLRAPTLIFGKEAIVGYHEDLYSEAFGS